jgi:uncharacterized protein (DUF1800 family)
MNGTRTQQEASFARILIACFVAVVMAGSVAVALAADKPSTTAGGAGHKATRDRKTSKTAHPQQTTSPAVAARFLEQTSWGPTAATISQLEGTDLSTWLQQQFAAPISTYTNPAAGQGLANVQEQFFVNAMTGQDQLRQRVSFALSEIMVVSSVPKQITDPTAFPLWMNMLQNDAFGNFFNLMTDVTLSPTMGTYLNMANNNGCATHCRPNENYARELLQLFTIGLDELNQDGTLVLDQNGNPIPTYEQVTVDGFGEVFTGWSYPGSPGKTPHFYNGPYYDGPMVPYQKHYSKASKTLLNGATITGGGQIQPDLNTALQDVFNHPNVAPFICQQLIQKLVTSNPIPAYVSRCSQVFNNDGTGVRGNMQAVISEILLDSEARRGDDPTQVLPADGHLREPLLYMMYALRAMNATTDGVNLTTYSSAMLQSPFAAPSVFNFYPPNFEVSGINILGPEFKILNNNTTMDRVNFINDLVYGSVGPNTQINIAPYVAVAGNVGTLLDLINTNMMHGAMPSDMYTTLQNTLSNPAFSTPTSVAQAALYLVASSSQFQVED